MPLSPGTRLGPYEIVAPLGAGGMGEVYRAHDPRLGREVAIKVLPDTLAHDADRLARFEREARLLAVLSHAGIASIFGVEEADGSRALVMELVEGPTLAERIAQGALAGAEALPIARQLAEALEYAHAAARSTHRTELARLHARVEYSAAADPATNATRRLVPGQWGAAIGPRAR